MDVMQAVIYTRVSTDRTGRGRSVEDQELECRAECERKGWPVRKVFCDNDIGASRHSGKSRPQWELLKADIGPGDIVVMWEASRSNRDLAEFVKLRTLCDDLGVPLSYGGKQLDMSEAEDRFTGGLDALLSEREAEVIRARVLRGKRSSAAAGRPYGRPPWGLRRANTVELQWELDPVEAPRLRGAMDRALRGDSLRGILTWLKATGYAPASVSSLRRGLCNPAVAGLRVHQVSKGNVETTPATWPAIVERGEQERLLAHVRHEHAARGNVATHLLSGIATCGVCGGPMEYRMGRGGRVDQYRCRAAAHVVRSAVFLEGAALAELVKGYVNETPLADDTEARSARDQIAKIEDQLADYEEQAIAGDITAAAFARIERGLLARISDLRPRTLQAIPNPFEFMKVSLEEYMAADIQERRDIMRARVSVVVNPVPVDRKPRRSIPEDTVVTRLR